MEAADVIMIIGANPTDAHPVFASQMKRRLREGARLIILDPRRIDLVKSPHVEADYHLPLLPGTNVAMINALAHVIVTEGLVNEALREGTLRPRGVRAVAHISSPKRRNSPEAMEKVHRCSGGRCPRRCASLRHGRQRSDLLRPRRHRTQPGLNHGHGHGNLAMATGNLGKNGVGINPLRGQNNVQGSCDMGSFPHEFPGYRHVSETAVRESFEKDWHVALQSEPGLRIPNMIDAAVDGTFKGIYVQGEDIVQSDPEYAAHLLRSGLDGMRRRPGSLPQRNRELRARLSAGIVVP